MRILPEGGITADSPAVTPANGPIRQSQQIVASNAAAASKATGGKKGSEGSSTMAARRLQGPRLCKPIHLECSIEGLAGGRQGRSCFEGAVA